MRPIEILGYNKRRAQLAVMRRAILAVACFALSLLCANAQTNTAKPGASSGRYLLIVETSRTMEARLDGSMQAIADLLGSGMRGQIRRDDSLGVWTFSSQLNAGHFPLETWSPQSQQAINSHVLKFLAKQKFEKSANLDKVMAALKLVILNSDALTVVLVSSGEDKIHGTPFDDALNKTYASWRDEQKKAHMPIVTVLRSAHGALLNYSVTAAPWHVQMPSWSTNQPAIVASEKTATKAPPQFESPSNWPQRTNPLPSVAGRSTAPPAATPDAPQLAQRTDTSGIDKPESTSAPRQTAGWVLEPGADDLPPPVKPKPKLTESPATLVTTSIPRVEGTNALAATNSGLVQGSTDELAVASVPFRSPPPPPPKAATSQIAILKGPVVEPTNTVAAAPAVNVTSTPPSSDVSTAATTAPAPSSEPAATLKAAVAASAPSRSFLLDKRLWIGVLALCSATCVLLVAARRRPATPQKFSLITRSMDAGEG